MKPPVEGRSNRPPPHSTLTAALLLNSVDRVVHIGYRSIAYNVSPTLFQYHSRYCQYFLAQDRMLHQRFFFWQKIRYLSDTFYLK